MECFTLGFISWQIEREAATHDRRQVPDVSTNKAPFCSINGAADFIKGRSIWARSLYILHNGLHMLIRVAV